MKLKVPTPAQALAAGSRLIADVEWFRYWRELGRILGAHTHDGGDTPRLDHAGLSSVGANSHDEIDEELDHLDVGASERLYLLERRVALLEMMHGYQSEDATHGL